MSAGIPIKFRTVWIDGIPFRTGWTDNQAPGAIPNGTRIVKVWSDPGDAHTTGAEGVVLGSLGPAEMVLDDGRRVLYSYCVAWDSRPDVPVMMNDYKIATA